MPGEWATPDEAGSWKAGVRGARSTKNKARDARLSGGEKEKNRPNWEGKKKTTEPALQKKESKRREGT